jgi:hypothetical protein
MFSNLHAELEGGAHLPQLEMLLRAWQEAGSNSVRLGEAAAALDRNSIQTSRIESGTVEGRAGTLATQALP